MFVDYKKDILFKIPILGGLTKMAIKNEIEYGPALFLACLLVLFYGLTFVDISPAPGV